MNVPATIQLDGDTIDAIAKRVVEITGQGSPVEPEPWIGVEQAAEHLACSPRRIYALKAQNRIPHALDGTRLLFRRSDLDAALEHHEGRAA